MNKATISKFIPHIAAILLFICISFVYFSPVIEGLRLVGHDTQSWSQMAKESCDYNNTHSDVALWTNSMFGGMPTYQISLSQPNNMIKYVDSLVAFFPHPVGMVLLYMLCFYIMLLCFRVKPWLSFAGSLAFTFASYNFIIIVAGHNSKAYTIAYMAALIGSVYMAFRWKRVTGSLLTALFLSLAVRANHVQILYYTLYVLLFFGLAEFVYSIIRKELSSFFKSAGLVLVAVLIGVGMNATSLLTTYDYSQETMRGGSNGLTMDKQNSQHGLNKDYITSWSYGIDETMTLLIPDFKGGASNGTLAVDSETGKTIAGYNVPDVANVMKEMQLPLYWGTQPGTSGPVYFGAIICFLFVLGLFIVDRRTKWWLLPMIVLTLLLSWGKNFMWFTDLFIDYIPMYNKFRTVSMILVATGFGVTLMALLALKEVLSDTIEKKKLIKYVSISAGIVGGIALTFALIPSLAGNFEGPNDAQLQGNYSFLRQTLPVDRAAMLRADAFRSLIFIVLAAGLIWLYVQNKVKKNLAYGLFTVLFLADLVPVAKRYLNNDSFQQPRHFEAMKEPSPADNYILQDKSVFRMMDATVSMFNDASPSYFHQNIGGYHAAKLRRYQELINMQLDGEIARLFETLNKGATQQTIDQAFASSGVLNMLNMKYMIYKKDAAPLVNPHANGPAWLVRNIRVAADANEEMTMLGKINTKTEMVVDKSFADQLPKTLSPDTTAKIDVKLREPNKVVYNFKSSTDQVAVFSEIYYSRGWNAYVNGSKIPYVRANYLLRAMSLKAGNYEVEFRFEPKAYSIGNLIALISSLAFIISVIVVGIWMFKKKDNVVSE